jgi:UDP:flavonoid glycosyltransferase YjiC (YdhE family)
MRALFGTWDGAGNLPPMLALVAALHARGHEVDVMGHDAQQQAITQAGGRFHRFETAAQFDQGKQQPVFDFPAWFRKFNEDAAREFNRLTEQIKPHVLVIDCMMDTSITSSWASGIPVVALVHGTYSFMSDLSVLLGACHLALCCSYEDFDKGVKPPRNMTYVGPLRPPPVGRPWQRKHPERPFVVASLSTGIQGAFQLGLLQRVCDALATLPVEALVTTGRGIAPEQVLAGPNTTLERNVDHALSLPQATLFITHCGHGSVMAGLRAGVPMLCLPPITDQPHNARLVQALGLGETLNVMAPSTTITEAIQRMLANTGMQKAAKKFAKRKTYEPKLDKAVKLIEKLAR